MNNDIQRDRSKIRILAIEDEDLLREYVCDFLEDIGFTTLQAENGKIGVEMCRKEKPDLVLTDLRMPEMNGLDVLSILQKEFPDTPVIVISGTGSLNDVVQTLKFGAWDYILKPIHDYNILEMAVNRVLERKCLIDENKLYREHLEEEVLKRTEELIKSTTRFKTLFNLAGDAIFIHDLNGSIIDINEKASHYTGYTREELLKMQIVQIFEGTEVDMYLAKLHKLKDKDNYIFESTHVHRNGTIVPVEVNVCLITMNSETQVLSICRNISERKKAEEEKELLQKQIMTAQKMESIGLLASGVAHDFNNILSALTGYTFLLKQKMQTGNSESEYFQKINEIIQMGQSITKRITTFIRKDKEELIKVNIHKIIKDTTLLLRSSCKNVEIILDLNAEYDEILGDESQLQNMLLNLGINARDAMPEGGKFIISTLNSYIDINSVSTKCIYICAEDTGIGMTKEIQAKIFDPLFTTKERGKGTGLGLTSVLYCIDNIHGKITVTSEPGQGSSFNIYLPLIKQFTISQENKQTSQKSFSDRTETHSFSW